MKEQPRQHSGVFIRNASMQNALIPYIYLNWTPPFSYITQQILVVDYCARVPRGKICTAPPAVNYQGTLTFSKNIVYLSQGRLYFLKKSGCPDNLHKACAPWCTLRLGGAYRAQWCTKPPYTIGMVPCMNLVK